MESPLAGIFGRTQAASLSLSDAHVLPGRPIFAV